MVWLLYFIMVYLDDCGKVREIGYDASIFNFENQSQ